MDFLNSLTSVLGIVSMWLFFRKCSVKGWYALIPGFRDYQVSKIADRETDGIIYLFVRLISRMINIGLDIFEDNAIVSNSLLLAALIMIVPHIVYSVRIYIGLCEKFGKSKKWLWCWLLADWIAFFYWTFKKDYIIIQEGNEKESAPVSGIETVSGGDELTVNIRERTVGNVFRKYTLLKDIHLSIQPGHMVLLLGGSGAGKTTFLNAITGYETADADIQLGSDNLYKQYKTLKHSIGFVPQQDLMRGCDTVYRTLADSADLRLPKSINSDERKKRIDEVLDLFGLGMLKSSLVSKLSGGQRKRLSVAMEYIADPKLFILDEPDSGLDGVVARGLFEKLREIANQGKIVIVITHTPDRVRDLFDDVIVLAKDSGRSGRLAYFGSVNNAFEFFGKDSFEGMLLAVNQKEEGGEGRAEELVNKYNLLVQTGRAGGTV